LNVTRSNVQRVTCNPKPIPLIPDLEQILAEYGLWGLGGLCFLGATLVPVSSEVAVVAALQLGLPAGAVLLSASLGNALGASTDYALGRWLSPRVQARLEASRGGRAALRGMQRYGRWGLLGSWLPVLGDPLCLAAGLFRIPFSFFVTVGVGTRILRYWVLIYLFRH
jgi:membrane protein YqaA with SNARE-associated domain